MEEREKRENDKKLINGAKAPLFFYNLARPVQGNETAMDSEFLHNETRTRKGSTIIAVSATYGNKKSVGISTLHFNS